MTGSIRRDGHGIAYLWGEGPDELAFVQGRAVALDRAWQIEVERWRALGQLAARLGSADPLAVEWDVLARRAGVDDLARRAFWALDAPTRRWVRAYVTGVNDGLGAGAARAPEFAAAGCAPGRWLPWTPLAVFAGQHLLFGSFGHQLWREHLVAALAPLPADAVLAAFSAEGAPVAAAASGSNAVGVAASRAARGAPLLAADPHRLIEAPGVYQQVGLACPEFSVVGLAFPGVPGVQHFGHTGGAAWVVTNAMAEAERLLVERVRRVEGGLEVREEDGSWTPCAHRRETVAVGGGRDVPVDILRTARGPAILGELPGAVGEEAELRVLSSPADTLGDLGFGCLPHLLRARSVADVEAVLAGWVTPVNAVLVADARRVRSLVAGRLPGRGPGLLAAADVDGLAVHANDRRPGETADLGVAFAPPHRARRLRDLLEGPAGLTVADLAAAQVDPRLGSVEALQSAIAAAGADGLSAAAAALRRRLLGFDGVMDAASERAGEFAAWRHAVVRRLAGDPVLRPLVAARAATQPFAALLAPWLDPVARIGDAVESLLGPAGAALGVDAAEACRAALDDVAGRTPSPWGASHRMRALHALGPAWAGPDVAVGGDGECVLATASTPGRGDACWRGPAARVVWDLGGAAPVGERPVGERLVGERPFGDSAWVVPHGADGVGDSPHGRDQTSAWLAGRLVPITTDPAALRLDEVVSRTSVIAPAYADPREPVHRGAVGPLGEVVLRPLRPVEDAALVHGWVAAERARFWGMNALTRADVEEIYAEVDALDTHDALLIDVGGLPAGLLQTYDPRHDPVGEYYDRRDGDVGVHLLLGPVDARPPRQRLGLTRLVCAEVRRYVTGLPGCRRVVAEPDAANGLALALLERMGFALGEEVSLPHKRARMAYLTLA